jgi:hypothetical protein
MTSKSADFHFVEFSSLVDLIRNIIGKGIGKVLAVKWLLKLFFHY